MYGAIGRSYRTELGRSLVWPEEGCDGGRFEVSDLAKEVLQVACELGYPTSGVSFARSVDGHHGSYGLVWGTEHRPGTWTISQLLRRTGFVRAIVEASSELRAVSMLWDEVSRGDFCWSPWQQCTERAEHYP
jgi:hypothetical protein